MWAMLLFFISSVYEAPEKVDSAGKFDQNEFFRVYVMEIILFVLMGEEGSTDVTVKFWAISLAEMFADSKC